MVGKGWKSIFLNLPTLGVQRRILRKVSLGLGKEAFLVAEWNRDAVILLHDGVEHNQTDIIYNYTLKKLGGVLDMAFEQIVHMKNEDIISEYGDGQSDPFFGINNLFFRERKIFDIDGDRSLQISVSCRKYRISIFKSFYFIKYSTMIYTEGEARRLRDCINSFLAIIEARKSTEPRA